MMGTTIHCRTCSHGTEPNSKLDDVYAVARALTRAEDFGIFELVAAITAARVDITIGGDADSPEAAMASKRVIDAHAKVVSSFNRVTGRRKPCRVCRLRDTLAFASHVAVDAVSDARDGHAPDYLSRVIDACKELAEYAGDEFPNEFATRAVLDNAAEVLLAALASVSPERGPN